MSAADPEPAPPRWACMLPCSAPNDHLLVVCYSASAAAAVAPSAPHSGGDEQLYTTAGDDLLDLFLFSASGSSGCVATVAADAVPISSLTPAGMDDALYRRLLEDALLHRTAARGAGDRDGVVDVHVAPGPPQCVEVRLSMPAAHAGGSAAHFVLVRAELVAESAARETAVRRRASVGGADVPAMSLLLRLFAAQTTRLHASRRLHAESTLAVVQLQRQLETVSVTAVLHREEELLQNMVCVLNEKKRKLRELAEEVERLRRADVTRRQTAPSAVEAEGQRSAHRAPQKRSRSAATSSARVVKAEPEVLPALRADLPDSDEDTTLPPRSAQERPSRATSSTTADTTSDSAGTEARSRDASPPPSAAVDPPREIASTDWLDALFHR
ncbi:hypothetical protein NESM_000602600 [Novymonas esmeraldas]|uniref:Uncharacterized protein n=1 Tax=Novymonas esmeraldas TaxID=1808958 RepID=A0AAW0EV36_9TRYP